jgi:DNA-binding response OmpR family regulator
VSEELTLLLEEHGYDVKVASNGKVALEVFAGGGIDLVLTDIYMPKTDGLDLLVEIKKVSPGTKALVMSGGDRADGRFAIDEDSYATALQKYGGVEVLKKPFRGVVLVAKIGALLRG